MSYRDDHDAALARADALEGELERERARRERAEQELAAARPEARSEPVREVPPAQLSPEARAAVIVIAGFFALVLALLAVVKGFG